MAESSGDGKESDQDQDSGSGGRSRRTGRRKSTRAKGKSSQTAQDLLTEHLLTQADSIDAKLRLHLTGKIETELSDTGERFLFDWSGEELISKSIDESAEVDCQIQISSGDIEDIASGELNPQVAMLSHKIHVTGKLSLAVYFFNLFAGAS